MNTLRARESENFPLEVLWLDELGRPLEVENVTYEVFYYTGGVRTFLVEPAPMAATDESFRFIMVYTVLEGSAGMTLFCTYRATLSADNTDLISQQVLQIEKPISVQKMGVSF